MDKYEDLKHTAPCGFRLKRKRIIRLVPRQQTKKLKLSLPKADGGDDNDHYDGGGGVGKLSIKGALRNMIMHVKEIKVRERRKCKYLSINLLLILIQGPPHQIYPLNIYTE